MRTVGWLYVPCAGTTPISVVWGISVTRASDVGGTEPNPLSNPSVDWMWQERVFATYSGATVDSFVRHPVNIRSKRRVDEVGQTLALSINNQQSVSSVVNWSLRVLVRLP